MVQHSNAAFVQSHNNVNSVYCILQYIFIFTVLTVLLKWEVVKKEMILSLADKLKILRKCDKLKFKNINSKRSSC